MRVIDTVNLSIKQYPELYLKDSFENSKFSVLHHYFIVLGNGIEWAYTEDVKQGGYLTHPIYTKINDEYIRAYDPPYGNIFVDLDERYFSEDLYGVYKINHDTSKLFNKNCAKVDEGYYCFLEDLKLLQEDFKYSQEYATEFSDYDPNAKYVQRKINKNKKREKPYPNFQKKYSCFWGIDIKLIQEDWRIEGINHLKYWLDYFNSDQIINLDEYPNDICAKRYQKHILEYSPNKSIEEIAKAYQYPEFNGDYKKLAEFRFNTMIKDNIKFLEETISLLEG